MLPTLEGAGVLAEGCPLIDGVLLDNPGLEPVLEGVDSEELGEPLSVAEFDITKGVDDWPDCKGVLAEGCPLVDGIFVDG